MSDQIDHLVVGAGFFGAVVAERLARYGRKVLLIDRRQHIGGNSWSVCEPETGIEYHPYGNHIFHTSSKEVMRYLEKFTRLNAYCHRVSTLCQNKLYPLPINLEVINTFFGKNFSSQEARQFIKNKIDQDGLKVATNLEEKAVSLIGRELYEAFIRGYTLKQWGRDPRQLPPGIITRLPMRFDKSRDYFHRSRWQGIPTDGYAKLFERILAHENIRIETGVDFHDIKNMVKITRETVFTGPIDDYFETVLGPLDWRSVRFKINRRPVENYQQSATVNFADVDIPHTRIHEPKHLHPERNYPRAHGKTLVIHEYPENNPHEPYYPICSSENLALLRRYQKLARKEVPETVFGGRLGSYAYLDMDMTIASALACARSLITS